jgi:putative DNA primase/helicase
VPKLHVHTNTVNSKTIAGGPMHPRLAALRESETDEGNSARLVIKFGDVIRYIPEHEAWVVWTGQVWARDTGPRLAQMLHETNMEYEAAAKDLPKGRRKAALKWVETSQGGTHRREAIAGARDMPGVQQSRDAFNIDPFLLNCSNGTLNLHTGELQPHNRADFLTRQLRIPYDPDATAPRWDAFLLRIMGQSRELIDFLQRAVGYSLTGDIREHCLFLLHGSGRNGKTVFLETIAAMLGPYADAAEFATFLYHGVKPDADARNGFAKLAGLRYVTADESSSGGGRFDEGALKMVTGGGRIVSRHIYENEFTFTPQFKLWFATNDKPEIRDSGDAIWQRVRLIPFLVQIPLEERDLTLADTLIADELPGVLRWAVEGCALWFEYGLAPSEIMERAVTEYREDSDALGPFVEDYGETGEGLSVLCGDAYKGYQRWAVENGRRPMTHNLFGRLITARPGIWRGKTREGHRCYYGFRLTAQYRTAAPPQSRYDPHPQIEPWREDDLGL